MSLHGFLPCCLSANKSFMALLSHGISCYICLSLEAIEREQNFHQKRGLYVNAIVVFSLWSRKQTDFLRPEISWFVPKCIPGYLGQNDAKLTASGKQAPLQEIQRLIITDLVKKKNHYWLIG